MLNPGQVLKEKVCQICVGFGWYIITWSWTQTICTQMRQLLSLKGKVLKYDVEVLLKPLKTWRFCGLLAGSVFYSVQFAQLGLRSVNICNKFLNKFLWQTRWSLQMTWVWLNVYILHALQIDNRVELYYVFIVDFVLILHTVCDGEPC